MAQSKVIQRAIEELHTYIDRKTGEMRRLEARLRGLDLFNHRQVALIRHALKHPFGQYTIEGHRKSHNVVYQTARVDLLDMAKRGVLEEKKRGRKILFVVPKALPETLSKLEKEART